MDDARGYSRTVVLAVFALLLVTRLGAQQQALTAPTDPAAIERGQQSFVQQCGFCHGANARGGSSGPDLTRSTIVLEDENGKQLGDFLRGGRPDRGMPAFDVASAQASDLATFLHAEIYNASNRRLYKILNIVVGDAKAGEAYFTGAGRCSSCHSATGDLRGIGAKYEPATLQGRLLLPRGRPTTSEGGPPAPLYLDRTAVRATVTLPSGEAFTGAVVRLTDFDVTIYDARSPSRMRSWLRTGDAPQVTVTDPLQAHVDQLTKWTDTDMHNMTAYLASLK
jgi:cytochrome c oxidase cbb3-type subunit III